jgi:hypothetical protein
MEIDERASKCPHCHSYQYWHSNPNFYAMALLVIFAILFGIFEFIVHGSRPKDFSKYSGQFVAEKVSQISTDDKKLNVLVYRIKNNSKLTWHNVEYTIIGTDDKGSVVLTDSRTEYDWTIRPGSEMFLTIRCEKNAHVKNWGFKITNMASARCRS